MLKRNKWLWIVLVVLSWRLFLSAVAYGAQQLPYQPTFPYAESLARFGSRNITTWAQFDGVHYLTIIEKGYKGTGLIQAFFPLYPMLVRVLSFGQLNPVIVGVIISTVSFGFGLWYLYRLIRIDEDDIVTKRTLLLLLVMPVSFYFTAVYTEGLFFLFIVLSFYFARTERWWWAGVMGVLAANTRLTGVFLIPALMYEYKQQHTKISISGLSTLLPVVGLGGFMLYLQIVFHDALLFFHAQKDFGANRTTDKFILLHQVFYRYVKMFLTVPITSRLYYTVFQEFAAGIIGLAVIVFGWLVTRKSYVIFSALCFLTPTLTGTFSSMPRYFLPLFPVYLVIAKIVPSKLYYLTVGVSFIMLCVNIILFTQGLWVS